MSTRQQVKKCPVCHMFRQVSKSAPWWQRTVLALIAKVARENPEARDMELYYLCEKELAVVNAFMKES